MKTSLKKGKNYTKSSPLWYKNEIWKSVCCDICLTALFYTLRLKFLQHIQAIIHTIYSNYGKNRKYDVHLATYKIQQTFDSDILLNSIVKPYPLKLTKVGPRRP